MATTTPNFGWPVPTSTDLVKDGATAIEALGDSIDASLLDLKGGTSGQVLAKNSNTDMDFIWVTDAAGDITGVSVTSPLTGGGTSGTVTVGILSGTTSNLGAVQLSDSTSSTSTTLAATANAVKTTYDLANAAVAKSIVDAKGDLSAATAADTVSRLAVGTNGQVLVADSAETTGLKWSTPSSGAMVKITGNTFSNVASVTVDNCFSSTYRRYMLVLDIGAATTTDDVQIQFRYSGTTETSSTYYGSYFQYNRGNTLETAGFSGVAQGTLSTAAGPASSLGERTKISIQIAGVGANNYVNYFGQGITTSADQAVAQMSGLLFTQRTYDGFLIKSASTNITGSYTVYGLEN